MRKQVKAGNNFHVNEVTIIEAKIAYSRNITRDFIARMSMGVIGFYLVGAGLYGAWVGEFGTVAVLWSIAAVPVLTIFGSYFNPGKDTS